MVKNKSNNQKVKHLRFNKYAENMKILDSMAKKNFALKNQIITKITKKRANSNLKSSFVVEPHTSLANQKAFIPNGREVITGSSFSLFSPKSSSLSPASISNKSIVAPLPTATLALPVSNYAYEVGEVRDRKVQGIKVGIATRVRKNQNLKPLLRSPIQRYVQSLLPRYALNSDLASNTYNVYNFKNNKPKFNLNPIINNASAYMGLLISKPVFDITPKNMVINSFFYVSAMIAQQSNSLQAGVFASAPRFSYSATSLPFRKVFASAQRLGWDQDNREIGNYNFVLDQNYTTLQSLSIFISKKLKKPIEFDFTRLHHPTLESQILANTMGYLVKNTRINFRRLILKISRNTKIRKFRNLKSMSDSQLGANLKYIRPTSLLGFRIKLGGRLLSQKIVPRFTSRTHQKGNLGRTKAHLITTSRFTAKNKRGAFSFTVKMGHVSFA